MKMTSVSGHLLNYDFEERYRKNWHSCRPSQLFDLPVVKRCNDEFGLKIKVCNMYIHMYRVCHTHIEMRYFRQRKTQKINTC